MKIVKSEHRISTLWNSHTIITSNRKQSKVVKIWRQVKKRIAFVWYYSRKFKSVIYVNSIKAKPWQCKVIDVFRGAPGFGCWSQSHHTKLNILFIYDLLPIRDLFVSLDSILLLRFGWRENNRRDIHERDAFVLISFAGVVASM